jgi:hypothetical protein
MSGFDAGWLALREAADHAARSERMTRLVSDALPRETVRVLDLGSGTGSNLRYLAGRLPAPQDWLLVDNDSELLAHGALPRAPGSDGRPRPADRDYQISTRCLDLASLDPSLFDGRTLVTASALLDLVSESWLHDLAVYCRAAGAAALFALTYDGRIDCSPAELADQHVRDLVNRHQRGDKGFGAALGPEAIEVAVRCFAGQGYQVQRDRSDWLLGASQRDLQEQLIQGWAAAAADIAPGESGAIRDWERRRLAHVASGASAIVVGHEDLAAWP